MGFLSKTLRLLVILSLLTACQPLKLDDLKDGPLGLLKSKGSKGSVGSRNHTLESSLPLEKIIDSALQSRSIGSNFRSTVGQALKNDPSIISSRREVEAKLASISVTQSQKEFQVSSSIYGGIEDITDNTKGVAIVINANRLIYDGGFLDAQISSASYEAESAQQALKAKLDERALRLTKIWVGLERYRTLQNLIESRLNVLDPLISQLERVAKAGIGDVSKVAAAQRTVSNIRVAQTNVAEGLAQAEVSFVNAFGELPYDFSYDSEYIESIIPASITKDLIYKSPLLSSKYAAYQADIASLAALKSKNKFNVGFQARASRPFGGSGYDSDESLGLVVKKTLLNGRKFESQIKEAEALAEASSEQIRAAFREGDRALKTAQQNIASMQKAIQLARENAEATAKEIKYLRQQLVIGGSTLDSVLSAEARLYDAESKEINFLADMRKSQLTVLATLGLLAPAFGHEVE
jgi:adhesin transport system outer membrane protein